MDKSQRDIELLRACYFQQDARLAYSMMQTAKREHYGYWAEAQARASGSARRILKRLLRHG